MNLGQFKNKKIAILGAGKEGMAMVRFLSDVGAIIEIRDRNYDLRTMNYELRTGSDYLQDLDQFDFIVRSPGIPWLTPEIQAARQKGVTVTSQTQIFFDLCPAHIIGVTGTKGKSTTASLIAHILKTAGRNVWLGGNIGESPIEWLDQLTVDDVVVLELSSFQLQGLTASPEVALVLDITTEHLDYHRDTAEYVEAKRQLVAHQKSANFAVFDADSLSIVHFAASTKAGTWWFSDHKYVNRGVRVKTVDGRPNLILQNEAFEATICVCDQLTIKGPHNWRNAAAASTVAVIEQVPTKTVARALKNFEPLPHRLQELGVKQGRLWVDDSVSTAPDALIAALATYTDNSLVLIVGGSRKGYGFERLATEIVRRDVKVVVLIGDTAAEIGQEIKQAAAALNHQPPLLVGGGVAMPDILAEALQHSKKGDTIIFSPACASFGLFKNVYDRAERFTAAFRELAP